MPATVTGHEPAFWFVTMVSNPLRYRTRVALYRKFRSHILNDLGSNLLTVELMLNETDPQVTDKTQGVMVKRVSEHEIVVQVRANGVLWHKEVCLNVGFHHLPPECRYVSWVDADLEFLNRDVVAETVHQLQLYKVVQMFQNCIDMGPDGAVMQMHTSFGHCLRSRLPAPWDRQVQTQQQQQQQQQQPPTSTAAAATTGAARKGGKRQQQQQAADAEAAARAHACTKAAEAYPYAYQHVYDDYDSAASSSSCKASASANCCGALAPYGDAGDAGGPAARPRGHISHTYFHPGYVWAARRETLDAIGGLLDIALLGSADHHMAYCMVGRGRHSIPERIHPHYWAGIERWQALCDRHVSGSVGYTVGTIVHGFHGYKKSRGYQSRWSILKDNAVDPLRHIKRNLHGVWELVDPFSQFGHDVVDYFKSRNEDVIVEDV